VLCSGRVRKLNKATARLFHIGRTHTQK
jgi:hypothetical protein